MAEESKGLSGAMTSLGATLTSPAKLAFAGFVVLVYTDKIIPAPSLREFIVITALFIFIQVLHDDYLRILLNRCASGKDAEAMETFTLQYEDKTYIVTARTISEARNKLAGTIAKLVKPLE